MTDFLTHTSISSKDLKSLWNSNTDVEFPLFCCSWQCATASLCSALCIFLSLIHLAILFIYLWTMHHIAIGSSYHNSLNPNMEKSFVLKSHAASMSALYTVLFPYRSKHRSDNWNTFCIHETFAHLVGRATFSGFVLQKFESNLQKMSELC